ncbi:diphthine synthase [Methanobacterium petrolearium]|uniref:diphthine synthase n=1 Tax=Methanobacterium petrolearium TaxID=710190 RepID=UPI001AEAF471|nr:diphthine synthase [Methanobacterium petrolearium]MBP1945627.1 diphthine synthase [Methanobacterium petrolearium]BDZ71858.1 diphthine synthase [Methanobacterium petrolearium]
MLYLVGLGLYDEKDISINGLEAIQSADVVYAEFYTARLFGGDLKSLENLAGVQINILAREEVEEDVLPLKQAENKDIAFLTAGDPLMATTHSDILMEAHKKGIKTVVIHSSSILSAAPGIAGLQAYKFGKVTTIPRPEENYFPHSPYQVIQENKKMGLHTLVLLDIQAHRDYYMTANEGLEYLLRVEDARNEGLISDDTLSVVIARAGSRKPLVRAGPIKTLVQEDFGGPLHCIIIPADLHFLEAEGLVILGGAPENILEDQ